MPIRIIVVVIGQVFVVMGIESMMKTEWSGFSGKMMMMGDDRMEHQQQIRRKQA